MSQVVTAVLVGCGAIVTLAGAAGVLWWLVKPRVAAWAEAQILTPVRETHHQVTVNHHSSAEPTVLDKIDTVRQEVRAVVVENREQNRKIDSVQRDVTALTVVLDAHLHGGDVGDEPDLD
ncbi:hypothetical protein GCM10009606_17620 [Nocardioides aquiterrae]|uniref:DUF2746 domain-containing protein n=1 Tax=Nocardioides aquiterrae TaxID=203799 RepID=A0ABP4EXY7_9ACTN